MGNNIFDSGIKPGGLRDIVEVKILICYLLKNVKTGLTKAQINEVLQKEEVANYFTVNDAISELIKTGNIEEREETLFITESGRRAAELLELDIPKSVREKTVNSTIKLLVRNQREKENKVETEKTENGYNITFKVLDIDEELMKLTLFVGDTLQVENLKKKFLENPAKIYEGIIELFTDK